MDAYKNTLCKELDILMQLHDKCSEGLLLKQNQHQLCNDELHQLIKVLLYVTDNYYLVTSNKKEFEMHDKCILQLIESAKHSLHDAFSPFGNKMLIKRAKQLLNSCFIIIQQSH